MVRNSISDRCAVEIKWARLLLDRKRVVVNVSSPDLSEPEKAVYTKTAFKALYELSKSFHSESTWGFQLYQVNRHTHLIASAARLQRTHHFPSGFEGPRR